MLAPILSTLKEVVPMVTLPGLLIDSKCAMLHEEKNSANKCILSYYRIDNHIPQLPIETIAGVSNQNVNDTSCNETVEPVDTHMRAVMCHKLKCAKGFN